MATADSLLLKELECPICLEELVDPVIAGGCSHSFCRNCLKKYVEEKARGSEFDCPFCRQRCQLPRIGIAGLQKNVGLANVIEKYAEVRKGLNQRFKCSYCTDANKNVTAALACPQCDDISLCQDCGFDHVSDPHTESHEVTAMCDLHGKPLKLFCKRCGRPICVVCLGKHSKKEGHDQDDVKGYRDVVKRSKDDLGLDAAAARGAAQQLDKHDAELAKMRSKGLVSNERTVKAITDRHESECNKSKDNIVRLSTEIEHHRAKMERCIKEKKSEEDHHDCILRERNENLSTIKKDHKHNSDAIDTVAQEAKTIRLGINDTVRRSETLISDKLLRTGLHDDIRLTQAKLKKLTSDAKSDRITPLRDRMRTGDGFCKEYMGAAGQFSSASLSFELKVPCPTTVYSVSYMSRDRIAALIWTGKSDKVLLWKLSSLSAEEIMQDKGASYSIAALGQDKLVVLRRASPIIKVVDVVTKTSQDIDVKLPKEAIDHVWSVEVVGHGNFIVTYGKCGEYHIVLTNSEGALLHNIESKTYRPTFCRMTGVITLCTNAIDTISCYQLTDNSLDEVMSAHHGVEGFVCYDICSGSLGEIFIVGRMAGGEPHEIRLYQLDIDMDKKTVSMKRIDVKEMEMRTNTFPRCSVHGNCLAIGYDSTVCVLKLST